MAAVALDIERIFSVENEDVSGMVLDMLSEVLGRLNGDAECDDIPVSRLGAAIGADAGVTLAITRHEPIRPCAFYPSREAADALLQYLTSADALALPQHFRLEEHPELGHLVIVSIRPDHVDEEAFNLARVIAFARRGAPYGDRDRAILERACIPLASLWPYAMRTYRMLATGAATRSIAERYQMSQREVQVLTLLSEGLLATSIASRLGLSPRTVHKHLGNIYRKLGVHDRLVAVSIARLYGLLDLPADER